MNTSQTYKDNDLSVPNQTWAILLISILGLFKALLLLVAGFYLLSLVTMPGQKESEKNVILELAK